MAALTFARAAARVLAAGDPAAKAGAAFAAAAAARTGIGDARLEDWPGCPDRPARPDHPALVPPGQVPRRRFGSLAGRVAFLHAIAHIEFNAIDLAFDMALRFAPQINREGLDWREFAGDWASVGEDEARHFEMVNERLAQLGSAYGALPAHDGLWQSAATTADDVLARLAIAPLVLEARGLDVTPAAIERLESAGDVESNAVLSTIYREEIRHVAIGVKWFEAICAARCIEPVRTFRQLVAERYAGSLKPPFNRPARQYAGLKEAYYAGLTEADGTKVATAPDGRRRPGPEE
jgi:uncharacterized ferritin-like protein (DUF455 family)